MGRIRTIKPEFCSSPDVLRLSRDARLFFLQLLTEVDDEGRIRYQKRRLAGVLYPSDDDVTPESIEKWVNECRGSKMIVTYKYCDDHYLEIVNFKRHQVINKPTKSKLPPANLPECELDSFNGQSVVLPDDYGSATGGLPGGKERKGKENKKTDEPFLCVCEFLPPEYGTPKNREAWLEYVAYRKGLGVKPYKEIGLKQLASQIVSNNISPGHFPDLLSECMAGNWNGIPVGFMKRWNAEHRKPKPKDGHEFTGLTKEELELTRR